MTQGPDDRDDMTVCETKRLFKIDGKKEYRWTEVNVSDLPQRTEVRCVHCHGKVRLHFKKQEHGTRDHCEHQSHQDSVFCRGGHFFQGEHRESENPVK